MAKQERYKIIDRPNDAEMIVQRSSDGKTIIVEAETRDEAKFKASHAPDWSWG